MIRITVDKNEMDKLLKVLNDGIKSLDDWNKPFQKFGVIMRAEQAKNFEQQGAIYQGGDFIRVGGAFANLSRATTRSSSWQKLTPATQRDRQSKGYPEKRPILVRSGELKRSFKTKTTKRSFTTENVSKLAIYHQGGTKRMPARRIMGFSRKGAAAFILIFERYLAGAFKMSAHKSGFVNIK